MKLNMYRQLFLKIIFLFFPCILVGHELWIDTSDFKVEKGTKVDFDLRNGENFDGFSLGYFDRSVEKLYWRQNGERFDNASRQGDIPALQIKPDKNGKIIQGAGGRAIYTNRRRYSGEGWSLELHPVTLSTNPKQPTRRITGEVAAFAEVSTDGKIKTFLEYASPNDFKIAKELAKM